RGGQRLHLVQERLDRHRARTARRLPRKEHGMSGTGEFTRTELFWDGAWRRPRSTRRLDLVSPSTEALLGSVPDADEEDVDAAVRSARTALAPGSEWTRLPQADRAEAIERLALALQARDQPIKE